MLKIIPAILLLGRGTRNSSEPEDPRPSQLIQSLSLAFGIFVILTGTGGGRKSVLRKVHSDNSYKAHDTGARPFPHSPPDRNRERLRSSAGGEPHRTTEKKNHFGLHSRTFQNESASSVSLLLHCKQNT